MLTKNSGDYFFVNLLVGRSGRNYPTRLINGNAIHHFAAKAAQTITQGRRLQPQKRLENLKDGAGKQKTHAQSGVFGCARVRKKPVSDVL